uniref:THAP domain-containing protein 2 n=1 Tax=Schizaphis graminum TaxID=13262 RepID=A0A2S2PR74_SCHGA
MVHRCILCCNASNTHKHVSFHQFPKDATRRSIWIECLSIKQVVKDWHRICSSHFSPDHFTFSNERKILKVDAIPLMNEVKDKVTTCEASLGNENLKSNSLIDVDCFNDNSVNSDNSDINIPIVTHIDSSNETPPNTSKSGIKKKYMSSSRIGDLEEDDFLTPKRRKRNLIIVKNAVTNLRKKNKLLTQNNVRLKKRVDSLNNIVKELKNKSLISENAAINLEVRYTYNMCKHRGRQEFYQGGACASCK